MVFDEDVIHLPNGTSFSAVDVRAASTGGSKMAAHGLAKALMRLGIDMEDKIQFSLVDVSQAVRQSGSQAVTQSGSSLSP